MDSAAKPKQTHVVCIAYPAQSHIKAVLKLAKLLHSRGIFITFVNTEYNHKRFLRSGGPNCLDGVPGFRFETIPDGLPQTDVDVTQDTAALCRAIQNNFLAPFQQLMEKLNENDGKVGVPPITSIVSDGFMTFTIDAAKVLGIPIVLFWTIAASSFMGVYHYHVLLEKGLTPLKDESFLTNGYLDTVVDWIPGMKGIRLKDLPSFIRTTDKNELVFNHTMVAAQRAALGTAHVLLTFDALEQELVNALVTMFPNFYTIGPLQILLNKISLQEEYLGGVRYSLWEEESDCFQWLESKEPNSVVYVNFGSITVLTPEQLVEFGWGLANSNHYFLWVIRPDLIVGGSGHFEREFLEVTREKGFIASWCPQEEVLNHVAVGGFLTHGGWNSTIESISSGVPMLCWPFFGDQITNCKYMCDEWKCGMEIGNDVRRHEVEKLVKELMDGVEGKRMKKAAMEWKVSAEDACSPGGSSFLNLDKLVAFLEN